MAGLVRATLALAMVVGLVGCETTKGFIRDSENLGSAIADELND